MAKQWMLQAVFNRGVAEDVAVCTNHFIAPDNWASSNWGTVETALRDAYQAPGTSFRAGAVSLREFRWYRGEPEDDKFHAVHRVSTGLTWAAGGSAPLPAQVASTVTEITERRKSWGRFYLPTLGVACLAGDGKVLSNVCALLADAWKAGYDAVSATGMEPVVKSEATWPWDLYPFLVQFRIRLGIPETSGNRYLPIRNVRVDNVWDVMRSRRIETVGVRETRALIDRGA